MTPQELQLDLFDRLSYCESSDVGYFRKVVHAKKSEQLFLDTTNYQEQAYRTRQ